MDDNRILAHAAMVQSLIDDGRKPDGTPIGDMQALETELAIDVGELVAFQTLKSQAQLMGLLTVDEAMSVYAALGHEYGSDPDNGGWGSDTTLAMKVTVTHLMGQLAPIAQKGSSA